MEHVAPRDRRGAIVWPMSKTDRNDTSITQGQALDIASRHLLRRRIWHWEWTRTKAGRGCDWVVSVGDQGGRIATVLVGADGNIEGTGT